MSGSRGPGGGRRRRARLLGVGLVATASASGSQLPAQEPPAGRAVVETLDFPPLAFDPPRATLHRLPSGVPVFHLEDASLPLVEVLVRFRGGYSFFPRDRYAAALALPTLLRSGGTSRLPADSLDALLDRLAVQATFGGGGTGAFGRLNVLSRNLEPALELWGEMLSDPGFDPERVSVWREREVEAARRRADDPVSLAFATFNHLMYGDHSVGWVLGLDDLRPAALTARRLSWVHRRVYCPENMVLGVAGDVSWERVEPLLREMLASWPPCPEPLPDLPIPEIRKGRSIVLVPRDLTQSTVVMAHASDVRVADDPAYFASRVANSILGTAGFRSRLMARVRTEEGYAYSASSLWTTPRRGQGLVGAVTRTRSDATVATTRLVLEILEGMRSGPPDLDEVRSVVDQAVNSFVFNFESPTQIVARQMFHHLEGLPSDWLERYLEGIQEVSPDDVHRVFREHVRSRDMVILVVGDPDEFDEPLESLGPVTILDVPDRGARRSMPGDPSGGPQSRS